METNGTPAAGNGGGKPNNDYESLDDFLSASKTALCARRRTLCGRLSLLMRCSSNAFPLAAILMRHFITIFLFSILTNSLFGQTKHLFGANNVQVKQIVSKIAVDKNLKGNFSFTKKWDYPEGVFKDDSTGEFTTDGSLLDTIHLFYTAKCSTNVQGGYDIRYCYATKDKNKITLTFADGLPAYASEFYVHIDTTNFWCDAETIYPAFVKGQKKSCTITKQKLILDKQKYLKGDTIKGFIEIEFIETVSLPNKPVQKRIYFLKGYFKTPVG